MLSSLRENDRWNILRRFFPEQAMEMPEYQVAEPGADGRAIAWRTGPWFTSRLFFRCSCRYCRQRRQRRIGSRTPCACCPGGAESQRLTISCSGHDNIPLATLTPGKTIAQCSAKDSPPLVPVLAGTVTRTLAGRGPPGSGSL